MSLIVFAPESSMKMKSRDSSDDSIATVLPFYFIPENEFNHHRVSNTSCASSTVAIAYNTSVARNSHELPAVSLFHHEDQLDHHSTIEQLRCKFK